MLEEPKMWGKTIKMKKKIEENIEHMYFCIVRHTLSQTHRRFHKKPKIG